MSRALAPSARPRQGGAFGPIDGMLNPVGSRTIGAASFSTIVDALPY